MFRILDHCLFFYFGKKREKTIAAHCCFVFCAFAFISCCVTLTLHSARHWTISVVAWSRDIFVCCSAASQDTSIHGQGRSSTLFFGSSNSGIHLRSAHISSTKSTQLFLVLALCFSVSDVYDNNDNRRQARRLCFTHNGVTSSGFYASRPRPLTHPVLGWEPSRLGALPVRGQDVGSWRAARRRLCRGCALHRRDEGCCSSQLHEARPRRALSRRGFTW